MNRLPFTKYASKALNEGREIAGYLGFKDVSSIFILLGLYGTDGSLASEVLKMHGVTRELIEEAVKEKSKMPKDRRRTVKDTPKTEYLLEIAGELAMKYGCDAIGSEHILMAMIKDGDNEAFRLLEDHKISCEGIYTDILVTAGIDFRSAKNEYNDAISYGGEEENQEAGMLEQYSTDLTEKAAAGKLDPMIGREGEMERLMQVLCRRTKNNPCLIGDPGVGKTAIVEGLAQRIADGNMPRILKNKRILSLDLTKVIAGTKFRGEFEERMKRIVTEATQDDSIILFIDEIHRLSPVVEEYLYSAMEDFRIDIMIDKGPSARSIQIELNPFTLVGATTRSGLLTSPLRARFGINCHLEYYDHAVLTHIIERSAKLLCVPCTHEAATEIAMRSRGTPRIGNALLRRVRDFAQVKGSGSIDLEIARYSLEALNIDKYGLDEIDNKILSVIIDKFKGGPVGLTTIATALGEDPGTLEEVYEPYLIKEGFIKRTPRGREVTDLAYTHLNRRRISEQGTLF